MFFYYCVHIIILKIKKTDLIAVVGKLEDISVTLFFEKFREKLHLVDPYQNLESFLTGM